jgi:tetratricopeptide (TPR) repeat protein
MISSIGGKSGPTNSDQSKQIFRILIADFDGPDPQKYRVTDNILSEIKRQTDSYKDVEVISLSKVIQERDGKNIARQIGHDKKADIVIWGWYALTQGSAQTSMNFEVLNKSEDLPDFGDSTRGKAQTTSLSQLDGFKVQVDMARELASISLVTLGMSRYFQKDWDGAITRLTKALESLPHSIISSEIESSSLSEYIYIYRARAFLNKDELDHAIDDYTLAISENKYSYIAYQNRGGVYVRKNENEKAFADISKALELIPNSSYSYSVRSDIYSAFGDYEKALDDANKALILDPKISSLYVSRAFKHMYKGEYSKALDDTDRALKLEFKNIDAYLARSVILKRIKDLDKALFEIDRAIEINPNIGNLYVVKSQIYLQKGERDKALSEIKRAAEKSNDGSGFYNTRGLFYLGNQEYEKAISDFSNVINLSDKFFWAYNNRGNSYRGQGNYKKSIEDLKKATKLAPHIPAIELNIAISYHLSKDLKQALLHYENVLELNEKSTFAYPLTAWGEGGTNDSFQDYQQAVIHLSRLVEKNPNDALGFFGRGITYRYLGNNEKAISDFKNCLNLDSDPKIKILVHKMLADSRGK